jgi:hypothetical protein
VLGRRYLDRLDVEPVAFEDDVGLEGASVLGAWKMIMKSSSPMTAQDASTSAPMRSSSVSTVPQMDASSWTFWASASFSCSGRRIG